MKIIMIIIYDKRTSNTGEISIITYIDYNVYNYSVKGQRV